MSPAIKSFFRQSKNVLRRVIEASVGSGNHLERTFSGTLRDLRASRGVTKDLCERDDFHRYSGVPTLRSHWFPGANKLQLLLKRSSPPRSRCCANSLPPQTSLKILPLS